MKYLNLPYKTKNQKQKGLRSIPVGLFALFLTFFDREMSTKFPLNKKSPWDCAVVDM
jgi:hypothetical protein